MSKRFMSNPNPQSSIGNARPPFGQSPIPPRSRVLKCTVTEDELHALRWAANRAEPEIFWIDLPMKLLVPPEWAGLSDEEILAKFDPPPGENRASFSPQP